MKYISIFLIVIISMLLGWKFLRIKMNRMIIDHTGIMYKNHIWYRINNNATRILDKNQEPISFEPKESFALYKDFWHMNDDQIKKETTIKDHLLFEELDYMKRYEIIPARYFNKFHTLGTVEFSKEIIDTEKEVYDYMYPFMAYDSNDLLMSRMAVQQYLDNEKRIAGNIILAKRRGIVEQYYTNLDHKKYLEQE